MTRKVSLHTPEVTAGPLKNVHISLVAKVTEMAHKRPQELADLNTVRESSIFQSSRRLLSDTKSVQVQGGGKIPLKQEEELRDIHGKALKDSLQISPTVSREVRDRDGWRDGESTKSYASGKFRSPQELFDSKVELELTFSHGDRTAPVDPIELRAELGLEQKLTHNHPEGANDQGAGGVFTGPARRTEEQAEEQSDQHVGEHAEQQSDQQSDTSSVQAPNAPKRLAGGRLDHSDVLVSLGNGGHKVLAAVKNTLTDQLGRVPAELAGDLAQRLDPFALKSALSRLSRGGDIRVPVDYGGWHGDVVVKARLDRFAHQESVTGFEFELGGQQRTSAGFTWDKLTRTKMKIAVKGNGWHLTASGEYARTTDSVRGLSVDRTGGTGSRGKSVEAADLFDGNAKFDITFRPKRLSRALPKPPDVDVPAVVAVPHRDVVRDEAQREAERAAQAAVAAGQPEPPAAPNLIDARGGRLGSSDIVTSVVPLTEVRPGQRQVDAVIDRMDTWGKKVLGFDWPGMKTKLAAELDFERLHALLKPMMSGHEILVTHNGAKAWVSAELATLTHEGDAPEVEFNTGTSAQTSLTSSDGATNTGGGHANAITVALLGTSDPLGTGTALTGGVSVTGARGVDHLDQQSGSSSTGTAVKAKLAADALDGTVRLKVRIERSPLVKVASPDKVLPGWARRWQAERSRGESEQASPFKKVLDAGKGIVARIGFYQQYHARVEVGVKVLAESGRYRLPVEHTPTTEHAPATEHTALTEHQPVPQKTVYAPPSGSSPTACGTWTCCAGSRTPPACGT